ncbi:DUF3231 family protein [Bacillus sp. BRMEA1]|uniref:DUF3231 family protein n=1 Tax=Neobacillus endophyticus TaxID=2738405 RepID=UPI00156710D9|nr:DUF3231 family protein [Neobacillus endophyticus]NRD77133.1 DUF3231 family protein [Neobacillus endophyticus]
MEHDTRLSTAEISQLWASYIQDRFSNCVLKYFLSNVEDEEIRHVLEYTLHCVQSRIPKLTAFFTKENFPLPQGFSEGEDVDLNAPRLFNDTYYLRFLLRESNLGLSAYGMALALSVRSDIVQYYTECLMELAEIHARTTELLLKKGIYVRTPSIPLPQEVEFVKKKSFIGGLLGDRRPLTAAEITHLYSNIQRNALGMATLVGYSQVAKNHKVKEYFIRGRDIAKKHVEVFSGKLTDEHLPAPMPWDTQITESTAAPFSDKLMMFQVTALNSYGMAYYGTSMSMSPRTDLGAEYGRLILEVEQYAADGAKIMIEHGWLEQPPMASD